MWPHHFDHRLTVIAGTTDAPPASPDALVPADGPGGPHPNATRSRQHHPSMPCGKGHANASRRPAGPSYGGTPCPWPFSASWRTTQPPGRQALIYGGQCPATNDGCVVVRPARHAVRPAVVAAISDAARGWYSNRHHWVIHVPTPAGESCRRPVGPAGRVRMG
jgi:hypothetical protein